jgi:hypothetical protein
MSHPLSPHTYHQIARSLPRPSAAQRARFLQHIATARPWAMHLPAEGGVPFTLFLNPQAGRVLVRASAGGIASQARDGEPEATARYRAAFGYLDYTTALARSPGALTGDELGLPQTATYYVLDEHGRAAPLPPELLEVASCSLNATVHPDAALLLETLPLRVPLPFETGDMIEQLDPITTDTELRAFAEEYVRDELGGFVCPTDREAWESRWLRAFLPLYAPRHADQRARLERALDGLLAWVYDVSIR